MTHEMQTGQVLTIPAPPLTFCETTNELHDSITVPWSMVQCCTQCGSAEVALVMADEAGEDYWRCYSCDHRSEDIDEKPVLQPTVIIIPAGSPFTPTLEDRLRWSVELLERRKKEVA